MTILQPTDNPYPVDSATHDCTALPVDLDPTAPEIVRWQELVDRDIWIEHDGDAEKVIPFPRPAWADPDCDIVDWSLTRCYYTSEWADVVLTHLPGSDSGGWLEAASVRVRAKLCGDGDAFVGMSVREVVDGEWVWGGGVGLTPAEATDLAGVLLAAVALIAGGEDGDPLTISEEASG